MRHIKPNEWDDILQGLGAGAVEGSELHLTCQVTGTRASLVLRFLPGSEALAPRAVVDSAPSIVGSAGDALVMARAQTAFLQRLEEYRIQIGAVLVYFNECPCDHCSATGRVWSKPCEVCGGTGSR